MILFWVKIFILYLIVMLLFYICNKKKEIKEHYLTYFLPYYNPQSNELYSFYKEEDDKKNYFISKFDYSKYIITGSKNEEIHQLTNELLAYTKLYNMTVQKYTTEENVIYEINANKIQFGVIPYSSYIYYQQYLDRDTSNCRLISKIYKKYFYILTKQHYRLYSVKDINANLKLGIEESTNAYVIEKIIRDIGGMSKIEFKKYKTQNDLMNALKEEECQVIFIWDAFPSQDIITFTQYNFDVILIPFDFRFLDVFKKKNYYLSVEYADLNLITSYLPIKFGQYEYNIYRPNMPMLTSFDILITHKEVSSSIVYTMMEFLGRKFQTNIELYISLDLINILLHEGSKKYLTDYGYISYRDDEICKYFVGVQACTKENVDI